MALAGLQVGIQIPDLRADPLLVFARTFVEPNQLMDQPLGMHPAQPMSPVRSNSRKLIRLLLEVLEVLENQTNQALPSWVT